MLCCSQDILLFCFIVPFLLKKKKNICNNVSFLSPFMCEEKHDSFFSPPQPLHGLSFFFFLLFLIMGKNHAARETACILTYDCLVSTIKPKMFTTACNTVRKTCKMINVMIFKVILKAKAIMYKWLLFYCKLDEEHNITIFFFCFLNTKCQVFSYM